MEAVTYEDAQRVVGKILDELGEPDWLQGVGIEPDPTEGYAVSVRILPGTPEPHLDARIDGVAIRFRRRKLARAFSAL